MNADDTLKLWASRKFDLPLDSITAVEFGEVDGFHYSTITYEPSYQYVEVVSGRTRREFPLDMDLGEVLRDVLAVTA